MSTVMEPSYQELVDYVAGCGRGVLETRQALLEQHDRLHTAVEQQQTVTSEQARLVARELVVIETELKKLCDTALPRTSGDLAEKINAVVQRVGALEGRLQGSVSKGQEQTQALLAEQRSQTGSMFSKLEAHITRSVEGLNATLRKQDEALAGAAKQLDARTAWLDEQLEKRFNDDLMYMGLVADTGDKRHKELQKRLGRILFVLVLCLIGVWYQVWSR